MPTAPIVPIVDSVLPEPLSPMIPGLRESGVSLTRFGVTPVVVHTMVDVTMDAAGRADRRREGGDTTGGRHPAVLSRWAALLERLGVRPVRETPRRAAPVTGPVALDPPVL
jgi:hypothetical protein